MNSKTAKNLIAIFAALALLIIVPAVCMAAVDGPVITETNVLNGVQISMTAEYGSAIYYTLDGTTPTERSQGYSAPFVLDTKGEYKIRAIAVTDGQKSSVAGHDMTLAACGYDIEAARKDTSLALRVSNAGGGRYQVEFLNFDGYSVFYTIGRTTRPTIYASNINDSKLYISKPTYISMLICKMGCAPELLTVYATQEAWKNRPIVADVSVENQSFYGGKTIRFLSDTEGASFRYRMSTSSSSFNGLMLDETNTEACDGTVRIETEGDYYLKAYACKDGYFDSDPTSLMRVSVSKCPEPDVKVEDSSVNGNLKVVTVTVPDGCDVFYTTDGTTPNEGSKKYTAPRTFGMDYTLKFAAMQRGSVSSDIVTVNVSGKGGDPLEKPVYSGSRAASGVRTITLTSPNDADIYYAITTSSTRYEPTAEKDTRYTEPIVLDEDGVFYIWARAYRDGEYSELFYGKITVEIIDPLAAPGVLSEILPSGIRIVRLSSVNGNKIYYMLSSEEITAETEIPQTEENLYVYPITLTQSTYLAAVAVNEDGEVSSMSRGYADIPGGPIAPEPVGNISMQSTNDGGTVTVTLDCEDPDADIFYSFDSNASGTAGVTDRAYDGEPISFSADGYLHVVAARPGYEYTYRTYSIVAAQEKTATPKVNATRLSGGTYRVDITCATKNAKFYYTTDGTTPNEGSSQAASGRAVVPGGVTLKVIAIADGYAASDVVTEILSAEEAERCGIVIPEMEDVIGGKLVYLTTLTDGASIYYTTNGTEPTADSLLYDETKKVRVTAEGETRIRARAIKSGMEDGPEQDFTVTLTRLATPKAAKSSNGAIILVAVEPGATVYYTLDGSIPNINSPATHSVMPTGEHANYPGLKCAQIPVAENGTFTAVAARGGYVTSYMYQTSIEIKESVELPTVRQLVRTPVMGGETVEIPLLTPGATLYYSLEAGSVSSVSPSRIYTGPLHISDQMNYITVLGTKAGLGNNKVQYTISLPKTGVPKADIDSNSVLKAGDKVRLSSDKVTVSGTDTDTTIFYTLDGTIPTVDSTQYTGPIEITGSTRIRAVAAAPGAVVSDVLELYYTVEGEEPSMVIDGSGLSVENGLVSGSVKVEISGVNVAGKRVIAAVYCDSRLIQAVSTVPEDAVSEVVLDGFESLVDSDNSIVVKTFIFENDESIAPVCESSLYIK